MTYDREKLSLIEAESIFENKLRFKTEKEFVKSLSIIINQLIENIYGYTVIKIEYEKPLFLREYGGTNLRADIWIETKEGIDIIIECKNAYHNKAETHNAIGQMIGYQINLELLRGNSKLILATSFFDFYMAKIIKRFDLDFDIILHNKQTTAYLLKSEL